ncbi:MAG: YbaB/EbfC family nucleoid-associated protein [Pseudomonadota bacterium]
MKNLSQMMKQAQQMQEKMAALQESQAELEVTGSAGAGLVTCTVNGKGELKSTKIDVSLLKPDEAEIVEDLIVAAYADARGKADEAMQEKMSELTGGLQLPPGFKLPF